jgi:hypothetical protein
MVIAYRDKKVVSVFVRFSFFASNAKMNAMVCFPRLLILLLIYPLLKKEWNCSEREVPLCKQKLSGNGSRSRTTKINFDKDNSICFVMNSQLL